MRKTCCFILSFIVLFSMCFAACGERSAEKPDSGATSETAAASTHQDAAEGPAAAEETEIPAAESSEAEEYAPMPVTFNDIILPLDSGFREEGSNSNRIIYYKEDFGRVTGYYKPNEARGEYGVVKKIENALDTDTMHHEVLNNNQLGIILFTAGKGVTGEPDRIFSSAVMNAGIDVYWIEFMADLGMADRQEEVEDWMRELISGIELTPAAAGSITPVPEVEYDFSVTPTPEPREVLQGILVDLNKADENEFEELYAASMETISANGLTESWDIICRSISAYVDYLDKPEIKNTIENYWMSYAEPHLEMPDSISSSVVRDMVEKGINPQFLDKIYTEGCELTLPPALWRGTDMEAYGYPETAPERQEGDPIRVLAVDCSDQIAVNHVGLESMSSKYRSEIIERFEKIWNQAFDGKTASVTIVTDPAQADVILELTLSYPVAGYYGPTGNVVVHNCNVNIRAWQPGTDNEVSADYVTEAGNTVSAPAGSTVVWMHVPDDIDNEIGTAVTGWFGE